MIGPGGLLLVVPDLYALLVSVLWVGSKTINNQTWLWKIFLQGHILWPSPPQNCKQLLYCRIQYPLMMTVLTHKRHYSPFKTLKDHLCFYIWTSNSHCPNPYLVEKSFKGVKMTTAKWTSIQERSRIQRYAAVRFNEKGVFASVGWTCSQHLWRCSKGSKVILHKFWICACSTQS